MGRNSTYSIAADRAAEPRQHDEERSPERSSDLPESASPQPRKRKSACGRASAGESNNCSLKSSGDAFAPAYYGMIADVAIGPGIPVHTMNGDCAHRWGGKPGKYSFQLSHVCFRPPTTVSDVLRECTARCIVQQVRVAAAASRHVNTHSRVCAYVLHVLHQHETSWTIFNRSNHRFTAVLGDYLPPEARVWGRIMLPFDDFLRVACWKLSEPAHHAVLTHRALTGLSLSDPSIGVLIGWHVETPDARFTRNLNQFLSDLKATRDLPDSSLNGHSLTSRRTMSSSRNRSLSLALAWQR